MEQREAEELLSAGIDLSGRRVIGVVLDGNNEVIAERSLEIASPDELSDAGFEMLRSLTGDVRDIHSLGIAVPGLVDKGASELTYSARDRGHSLSAILDQAKADLGPKVLIENDANCGAYGEYLLGAGALSVGLFYIMLGEGVGGSLVIDGQIWRGANGFAGEIGFMPIDPDGNRLEDVVSESAIVKRTLARLQTDHTSSLAQIDEEDIILGDILAAADAGDEFATMMIERTGKYLGVAIAGVINLLNVDTIVVGGTTMKAGERLLDPAKECAAQLSFEPAFASTKIVAGTLGDLAAAGGAALLSRAKLSNARR